MTLEGIFISRTTLLFFLGIFQSRNPVVENITCRLDLSRDLTPEPVVKSDVITHTWNSKDSEKKNEKMIVWVCIRSVRGNGIFSLSLEFNLYFVRETTKRGYAISLQVL